MCADPKDRWVTVFVGLGSNLGDRASNLQGAVDSLETSGHFRRERLSSFYETEPLGPPQPDFLNGVVRGKTDLAPEGFLALLKATEKALGRARGVRWGEREIDLDLLFYEEKIIESRSLKVPHPRLHEREFVLVPLAEVAPAWQHPRFQKTVLELLESFYLHEDL